MGGNHRWRHRSGGGEEQGQGDHEEVKAEHAEWYIVLAIVLAEGSHNNQREDKRESEGGEDDV